MFNTFNTFLFNNNYAINFYIYYILKKLYIKKKKLPTHQITESSAFKLSYITTKRFQFKKKHMDDMFQQNNPQKLNDRLANNINTGIHIK